MVREVKRQEKIKQVKVEVKVKIEKPDQVMGKERPALRM
jgi:hypothetical protein